MDRQPLFYASTFQFSSTNWYISSTSVSNHTLMPLTRTDHRSSSFCGGTDVSHASAPSFHSKLSTVLNSAVQLKWRHYSRHGSECVANDVAVCAGSFLLSPVLETARKIPHSQTAEVGVTVPHFSPPYIHSPFVVITTLLLAWNVFSDS